MFAPATLVLGAPSALITDMKLPIALPYLQVACVIKSHPSSEMGVVQSTGHVTSHRAGVEKLRLLRQTVCSDYS